MLNFFHTYVHRRDPGLKGSSSSDVITWLTNSSAVYDKLSLRHKIVHCVRQRFIHSYFRSVCGIYNVHGTSIFTDIEAMFDNREYSIEKQIESLNIELNNNYWDMAKSLITKCKYLNQSMPRDIELSIQNYELNEYLNFFLDHNTEEDIVPQVGSFDAVKGMLAFMLYRIRREQPTSVLDTFVPSPSIFYPMYGDGVIWVNTIMLGEPCQLPINKLSGYEKFGGTVFSYLNLLNISGVTFDNIMLTVAALSIIKDQDAASDFQKICNVINNHYLPGRIKSTMWNDNLNMKAFSNITQFLLMLLNEKNIKLDNLNLLVTIYDAAPNMYTIVKPIIKKAVSGGYISQEEIALLRKYNVTKLVPIKSSYNLIRMHALDEGEEETGDPVEEDVVATTEDEPASDEPASEGEGLEDADLQDSDTDNDSDPEGSSDEEEPEPEKHINEIDKKGIKFALSSGNLTLAELLLRESVVKKINRLLADPGDAPVELLEHLKYFRDHWLYLVDINTLLAITDNIEGV